MTRKRKASIARMANLQAARDVKSSKRQRSTEDLSGGDEDMASDSDDETVCPSSSFVRIFYIAVK
jgi:hypothetical protein